MDVHPSDALKSVGRVSSPGDRFGRFEVEAEIGSGTMGRVYRARDPLTGRAVAIKTMRTECLPDKTAALYRLRFQVEAQAAGGLSHPNVVRIFDQGEDYIVMEFLEGRLLSDLVQHQRFSVEEALAILSDVGNALDHAHSRGIVHRDVKPANVMVLHDGSSKLLDFGLARLPGGERSVGDRFLGTPSYMAPEQIVDGCASALSDLFSLSVVGYELLTGQKPFPGENVGRITYRVVYEDPPPLTRFNPLLPAVYEEIVGRMLSKDPNRRLPTAAAFVGALQAHRRQPTRTGAARPSPPRPTAPPPVFDELDTLLDEALHDEPLPTSDPRGEETQDLARLVWVAADAGAPARAEKPRLQIASDPVGVSVWIDGVRMGRTPLSLPLSQGPHRLRFIEEGFAPVQMTLSIPSGPSHVHVTLPPLLVYPRSERTGDRRDDAIDSVLGFGPGGPEPLESRRPD